LGKYVAPIQFSQYWKYELHRDKSTPIRIVIPYLCVAVASLNLYSIRGKLPLYDSTLSYAAAKAELINYSKSLSNEVAPKGGRALTVSPGWIMTDSSKRMMERISENRGITSYLKRDGLTWGHSPMDVQLCRKKLPNWWASWYPQGPVI